MSRLATLIARYGAIRVFGGVAVLLVAMAFSGVLGWAKVKAWYYEGKAERVTVQRDQARAETKVARKDEAQLERSTAITADTTAAQDKTASDQRAATTQTVEVIRERIREVPVAVLPADDPVVRLAVEQARARAQAASDRLQGTPGH